MGPRPVRSGGAVGNHGRGEAGVCPSGAATGGPRHRALGSGPVERFFDPFAVSDGAGGPLASGLAPNLSIHVRLGVRSRVSAGRLGSLRIDASDGVPPALVDHARHHRCKAPATPPPASQTPRSPPAAACARKPRGEHPVASTPPHAGPLASWNPRHILRRPVAMMVWMTPPPTASRFPWWCCHRPTKEREPSA